MQLSGRPYTTHYRQLALTAILIALINTTVFATPDQPNETVENESPEEVHPDTNLNLDSITVTATRNPSSSYDFPGQVTVITRDIIDDFNPSTVSDLFDAIPGARFEGGPRRNGETPSIRGLSGAGVLVLLDGARQSFLSAHDGRFFIDPDLLQQVEVVRGPSSALYGSGALGGVIALRTVTADDLLTEGQSYGFKLATGFQSVNDESRGSATAFWRSDDRRYDVVGSFTYRDAGDIELGNDFTLPADDTLLSSLLKTTINFTEDLSFQASWIRYAGDSVDPNNPQGINIAAPGNELVDRNIDSNTLQGGFHYAPSWSSLIDLNLIAYYTRNEVEENELESDRSITRAVNTTGISVDNRSSFNLNETTNLLITYGGEYYIDEQIGRDNDTIDGTRGGVPDATGEFYGLFVQAELLVEQPLELPGNIHLIPGIRWDRFTNEAPGLESTSDSQFSPKIALAYQPTQWLSLFGNWSEAFRAPSFNEIYADGIHFELPDPASFGQPGPPSFVFNEFIINPDLEPEQSQTWEVGGGLNFDQVFSADDRFALKASYYESDVTNLINLDVQVPAGCFGAPFPPCGNGSAFGNTSQNVNLENAEITGIELEANYDNRFFYARANFATIRGREVNTGIFVGQLAPETFFIDTGIKLPFANLRLGTRLTIAGDFEEVNDPLLARDGFTTGDIYLVWAPQQKSLQGFRVDLGIDNITDADFEVVAAGVSQPGRNFKVLLSWLY